MRGVLLLFILANLSFPGTLNFIGEVTALIAIVSIDTFSILSFIIPSFLSTFF